VEGLVSYPLHVEVVFRVVNRLSHSNFIVLFDWCVELPKGFAVF
jgi:hypothetical protein